MRNHLKIAFILVFVLIGVSLLTIKSQAVFEKTVSAESSEPNLPAESPRDLYQKNCARCHGADGKGQTELGQTYDVPDLTTGKKSTSSIVRIIKRGGGGMPAFNKKLKPAEITALAAYTKSLR